MAEQTPSHHRRSAVDYEQVDQSYMEKRQLQGGAAGWVLLAGLGVAYVISGDFAGWNFGLAEGGWGGLLDRHDPDGDDVHLHGVRARRAVLGAARPPAAATRSRAARSARWGGLATGTAILIEYAIAPAAIATFIGAYVESLGLFGITDGWRVYLAFYIALRRHPPLRRGRGAQADVRHHRDRGGGADHLRARDDPEVRRLEPHQHRADGRRRGRRASCRSATSGSGPRSRTRSGSSSPSRACRSPPRRRATPSATCRAA